MNNHSLSIIIPLGPDETDWPPLLDQLAILPVGTEVLLVGHDHQRPPPPLRPGGELPSELQHLNWHWFTAPKGRAQQLNKGASEASGDYLWFLHADSQLTSANLEALKRQIGQHPGGLYYFDLWFYDKHSPWLRINEWGARFRSNWLGVPFGDQGLCLSQQHFNALGGYPETAPYGEDHLLVWAARQHGLVLRPCRSALATSARKYQQRGWGKLTLTYQFLWIKQAWPQWLELRRRHPSLFHQRFK